MTGRGRRRVSPGILSIICLLLLLLPSLAACREASTAGKSFRLPLAVEPRQLDPQIAGEDATAVLMSLYEGLTRLDESGKPVAGAAVWQVSDDGLVYTFTLTPSLWSDGSAVPADDFLFGSQRAVSPATKSPLAARLYPIAGARQVHEGTAAPSELGVRCVGDSQLEITLTAPDSYFLQTLAAPPFFPCKRDFFDGTAGQYGLDSQHLLTNGPFLLKSWSRGNSLLLEKHAGYHSADDILPASVRLVLENGRALEQILSGSLDAAWLAADEVADARDKKLALSVCEDSARMLWFNNGNAALGNRNIRTALRESLEPELIAGQIDADRSKTATGFVPPDSILPDGRPYRTGGNILAFPASDAQLSPFSLLAAALAEQGLDAMPKLTLLCADDTYSLRLAQYIVQSWQKNLTLFFSIEPLPENKLAEQVQSGNYQLALAVWSPPDETALSALTAFTTDHPGNYSHLSDASFDQAAAAASAGSRADLESLEARLWEACPAAPITFECRYAAMAGNVSGILARPFNGSIYGVPFDFRRAEKR